MKQRKWWPIEIDQIVYWFQRYAENEWYKKDFDSWGVFSHILEICNKGKIV